MSAHLAIFEDPDLALQQLGDSGVTNGFMVDKLIAGWEEFRKTSENAKIKSMNYEKGSVCKKNNSRVVFTFSNGKTLNVGVNILMVFTLQLPQNVDKKEMYEKGMKMHNSQAKFLELFGGIDGVLPMPTIYYIGKCDDLASQEKPIILMEDLLPIDTCALPFNEMEVKSIINELANFHVHLWSVDNGWKNTIEKFPNSGKEGIFKQIEMFEEKKFEKFGELTINWESVKQFIEKALKAEEYAKLPDVLILNLNPNTLVFSGNPLRLTLNDFQVWVGPMLYNLVKVCMLSQWWSTSNTTERRGHEMEMLSLYYDQIMEKSNNQCCGFELSLDALKNAYRFQKFLAAIEALIPCLTMMNMPSHIQMPEETKEKFLDGYIKNQESFIKDAMEILNEY